MIFDAEKKEAVKQLFAENTHQAHVIEGLYKMVLPEWDNIESINGWPKCGKPFWLWISQQFMDFDRIHHPGVFKGGAWMNSGFSVDETLGDFEVSLEGVTFTMKG